MANTLAVLIKIMIYFKCDVNTIKYGFLLAHTGVITVGASISL